MIDVTAEQAIQYANQLRRICAATEILNDDGSRASVTVSIGLASSRQNPNLPDIMRTADRALYVAKHEGRNRVVVRADLRATLSPPDTRPARRAVRSQTHIRSRKVPALLATNSTLYGGERGFCFQARERLHVFHAASLSRSIDDAPFHSRSRPGHPGNRRAWRAQQCARSRRACRGLGIPRIWVAEHHNMAGIASAATSIVLAHIAEGTTTIRVGAGGIMLPNHAPYVIAEQFGTLGAAVSGPRRSRARTGPRHRSTDAARVTPYAGGG